MSEHSQRETAETAVGCAVFDMLAQAHLFEGFFHISVEDDGGFLLQLLEPEYGGQE
jgi:hypothetical protein